MDGHRDVPVRGRKEVEREARHQAVAQVELEGRFRKVVEGQARLHVVCDKYIPMDKTVVVQHLCLQVRAHVLVEDETLVKKDRDQDVSESC